jgi:hypothetical protein
MFDVMLDKPPTIQPDIDNPWYYWSAITSCYRGDLYFRYKLLPQVKEAIDLVPWQPESSESLGLELQPAGVPNIEDTNASELGALEAQRQTRTQELLARPGQGKFRDGLIEAYGRRCAVTGCDAVDALEAAHIEPYCESLSNCLPNGLLLRADIHRLFDLDLIGIEPIEPYARIRLSPELLNTSYRDLDGRTLSVPVDESLRPCKERLGKRWMLFQSLCAT